MSWSTNKLEMLARWTPSVQTKAGFSAGLEEATRTVRVMGSGIWHQQDADLYFEQQRRVVEEARRRYGPLKVFFDVRRWVVENPQSALQFQDMNAELYGPGDRLVAVVNTFAAKQYPRTALSVGNREVFVSLAAAESWLQARSPSV